VSCGVGEEVWLYDPTFRTNQRCIVVRENSNGPSPDTVDLVDVGHYHQNVSLDLVAETKDHLGAHPGHTRQVKKDRGRIKNRSTVDRVLGNDQ